MKYDTNIVDTQFYDKVSEYSTLNIPSSCIKLNEYIPTDKQNIYYKIFLDFETITHKTHKPYLVRYETEDDIKNEFHGVHCALDMLNHLPDETHIMLIAHNANYDSRFLLQYLAHPNPLVKGSRILTCDGIFYRYGDYNQLKLK